MIRVAEPDQNSFQFALVVVDHVGGVSVVTLVDSESGEAEAFALFAVQSVAGQIDSGMFWDQIQKFVFELDIVVDQDEVFKVIESGEEGRNLGPG